MSFCFRTAIALLLQLSEMPPFFVEDEDGPTHSIGIAEIDARLEALQKFMQDNMN